MSKSSFLRLETAEKNIEYWDGETKVAFINDSGTIQATRGHAERKEELLAWIGENYPDDLPGAEDDPEDDSHAETAPVVETESGALPTDRAPSWNPLGSAIPPKGSPELGEKDPAVIAWHFQNNPEKAKAKYARCKHLWPR